MRPTRGRDLRIGALALAAVALLGGSPAPAPSPSAGPGPVPPPPGPACQAGEPDPVDAAAIEAFAESLRRHAAARRAAGREAVVGLDGGGYGYGRPPHPFTQIPSRDE
jgi:hypothetical protein